MGLSLNEITFHNFRNYKAFELADIGPLTVFVGENAVGKTNIIEGIQLMTALASFRHPTLDQVVYQGTEFARIDASFRGDGRDLALSLQIQDSSKRYLLNNKAKRTVDLKGLAPSVVFTPDDLNLVKGSQSTRRSALDALGSQLSDNYYLIRKDYEKVVRYKNRLLKEEAPDDLIASIDETLMTCGAQLACYRVALFMKLSPLMAEQYAAITDGREAMEARYIPSWEKEDGIGTFGESSHIQADLSFERVNCSALTRDEARKRISAALAKRRDDERARKRALVGPHVDEIEFSIEGKNAGIFGSQGQQRSLVLAFKLAEVQLIQDILHQKPVLLLDDVMSELDTARRNALIGFIAGDIQTFITTTNLAYFDTTLLDRARVVELHRDRDGYASFDSNSDL